MKKYKHKITGKIANQITNNISYSVTNESHTYPSWMIENSNDWEEMIECKCNKDYEIVTSEPISKWLPETFGNNQKILIIKRLSDNKVFVIGEMVKFNTRNLEIIGFFINGKSIRVLCKLNPISNISVDLSEIQKAKTKLFTTEDNIDIYVGNDAWLVHKNTFILSSTPIVFNNHIYKDSGADWKFANKSNAQHYILMNKPCLSFMDIIELMRTHSDSKIVGALEELVKSKLQ